MRNFRLYGLDRNGVVKGSERWAGLTQPEAERMAGDRLEIYDVVEVWEGAVRVLTLDRRRRPAA